MLDSLVSLLREVFLETLVYGIPTVLFAIMLSGIQFLKINKQNMDHISYVGIMKMRYTEGGIKIFFRGVVPYALMNGISTAIYPISYKIYNIIPFFGPLSGGILLALVAGLIETSCCLKIECREILRNKLLDGARMSMFKIFLPILLRNTVYWLPATMCDEISKYYDIPFSSIYLWSMSLGFIAGIATLPPDVYATRKFGGDRENYNISRYMIDIKAIGMNKMFAGAICRGIQIMFFSLSTNLSSFLKNNVFYSLFQ